VAKSGRAVGSGTEGGVAPENASVRLWPVATPLVPTVLIWVELPLRVPVAVIIATSFVGDPAVRLKVPAVVNDTDAEVWPLPVVVPSNAENQSLIEGTPTTL
jgi:hypothetical protein